LKQKIKNLVLIAVSVIGIIFFMEEVRVSANPLPAAYDLREIGKSPTVKNQGELETCWAVAATSAMESVLLPTETMVFSADHMSLQNPYRLGQETGGTYSMVMAYLTSWLGPVLEEDDIYGDGITTEGLMPQKHVQEMQMITKKDYSAIKQLVYEQGAVQTSIYMDMQGPVSSSIYYNEYDFAYCYTGEEDPNHDVLVIGWNDSYPKENFTAEVSTDGAFICQNSWGDRFGEAGVFYVSYEDVQIGGYSIAYTKIEETDNYDSLYQTDLFGWVGQLGYEENVCYFTNVYQSKSAETVEAIGIYAVGKDTRYTIYKSENVTRKLSLINREKIQSGTIENMGYYTIELEEKFHVEAGQQFAIIVEIETKDELFPVAAEYQMDEATQMVTIEDGEGYISYNGWAWESTETLYDCNVCLKVYTTNRP